MFLVPDPQVVHLPVGFGGGGPEEWDLRVERAFDYGLRQHGLGRELHLAADHGVAGPVAVGGPGLEQVQLPVDETHDPTMKDNYPAVADVRKQMLGLGAAHPVDILHKSRQYIRAA